MAILSDRRSLAISASALIVLWGVWLHGIGVFPPFVDETVHIRVGEINLQNNNILEGINLGRQFTIWWYMIFQPAQSSPLWVARTATLLAFLPGVASAVAIARLAAGRRAASFTAFLFIFSTYHFFWARLALADTASAGAVLLTAYFAYRLRWRVRYGDALLVGALLFVAVGAKVNNLPFLGVPIAAALVFHPNERKWSEQARWLVTALGTAGALLAAFFMALRLRGLDFLSNSLSLAISGRGTASLSSIVDVMRIIGNARNALEALGAYAGTLPFILLLLSLLILVISRRQRATGAYLTLCLMGPALILWVNQPQETRFYVVPSALLLLCGGIALALVVYRQPFIVKSVVSGLILIWGLVQWLPFTLLASSNPAALPLPERDYAQYIISDASGFGLAPVTQELESRSATQVIGILANCQGLRYTFSDVNVVECPSLNPNGEDREALAALMESRRANGVYVVLEDIPYAPSSAPGREIYSIEYPPGRPRLTIYDLSPQS